MTLKATQKQPLLRTAHRRAVFRGRVEAPARQAPRRLRYWMVDYPYLAPAPVSRPLPVCRGHLLPVPVIETP